MAIDFTKDVSSLVEGDLAGLSADELKILGRLAASSPIRIVEAGGGTLMTHAGNGTRAADVHNSDVAIALLKGWAKV